jgi:hypothetical protein
VWGLQSEIPSKKKRKLNLRKPIPAMYAEPKDTRNSSTGVLNRSARYFFKNAQVGDGIQEKERDITGKLRTSE